VHTLLYNEHLLFNMHGMNIKVIHLNIILPYRLCPSRRFVRIFHQRCYAPPSFPYPSHMPMPSWPSVYCFVYPPFAAAVRVVVVVLVLVAVVAVVGL